ncbi:ROK family protein [Alicyclobacillus cycloheptanicus]|uniref:fructokinase n=1 Tax=Alicyclobacillus cycloheptanicus TaxID=1457 RepID=A0ABT9XHA3_9BACL|nr:ROK family protein [Alicyclobacillus cycloheptanicus]MDQ0189121.1 fructokinase [Alicyclobacillus cycloheptanicus]WDM00249.1 ROK family protein [Alicyclobacillus cycloheptanicus]
MLIGGVEAGGTKVVCGIGNEHGELLEHKVIATSNPTETLNAVFSFFAEHPIAALGLGWFGPLDLNPERSSYGRLTSTPKLAWQGFPLLDTFQARFPVPVGLDTDVNAAVLGEARWGAAKGLHTVAYLTVGTGIGGGLLVEGRRVHGSMHPEVGHLLVRRHPDDPFAGHCPYHQDCLEGLAAGPALAARWGTPAEHLPDDHPAWRLEAYYLAQAVVNLMLTVSPQRIILGGGVMKHTALYTDIRRQVQTLLGGYLQHPGVSEAALDPFITAPGLGDFAGVRGALALALDALRH